MDHPSSEKVYKAFLSEVSGDSNSNCDLPRKDRPGSEQVNEAFYSGVRVPLRFDEHSFPMDNLSSSQRKVVELARAFVEKELFDWEEFHYSLPCASLAGSDKMTSTPLLKIIDGQADDSELRKLAIDPDTGENCRLTRREMCEIAEQGRFSIPGLRDPSVVHVWKLPQWIQRGRIGREEDFWRRIGYGLDHLLVFTAERIHGGIDPWELNPHSPSLRDSVKGLQDELINFVDLIIGLPRYNCRMPNFKESERKFMEDALNEWNGKASVEERIPVMFWLATRGSGIPLMKVNSKESLDEFRRYSEDALLSPIASEKFSIDERRARIRHSRYHLRDEGFLRALKRDQKLQDVMGIHDLDKAVQSWIHGSKILRESENRLRQAVADHVQDWSEHLKKEHGLVGLSGAWIDTRVRRLLAQNLERICQNHSDAQVVKLRQAGLFSMARVEELQNLFIAKKWPKIVKDSVESVVPHRTYQHHFRIIDPHRWFPGNGGSLVQSRSLLTSSATPGWRVVLRWRDIHCFVHNSIIILLIDNLWRGPIGVRSLVCRRPFPIDWKLVHGSRSIAPVRYQTTLAEKLVLIWVSVEKNRDLFERQPDQGLVSKNFSRPLHYTLNYVFRGGLSSLLIALFQLSLTALNTGVTVLLICTTPIWSLSWEVASVLWEIFINDWRSCDRVMSTAIVTSFQPAETVTIYHRVEGRRPVPLLRIAGNLLIRSVGQSVVSVVGVALQPVWGAVQFIQGIVGYAFRTFWDAAWRPLIGTFGRRPSTDSFLAQRVQGPEVSRTFYHQVELPVIIQIVNAALEQIELLVAEEQIVAGIRAPLAAARSWIRLVPFPDLELQRFSPPSFHPGNVEQSPTCPPHDNPHVGWKKLMSSLMAKEQRRIREVHEAFRERKRFMDKLLEMPSHETRRCIRPSDDPSVVLDSCSSIVEQYYSTRLRPLGDDCATRFWQITAAIPDDFRTATKGLLEETFSNEFLIPFEISDRTEIPTIIDDVLNPEVSKW
eukprot:CAMPEP_0184681268 /NCGR_PEP_ID=MMETSP0312-20130426/4223_1 /TAXON_ID=31354 /ORGANISM="Compsopogon coeruleus, Strain SAG 36.94" /LENGTH=997 /DNA_ID=CAMNT_0027131975 /DNA_START=82 /DNA_END=3072 /DNA_ORIENTATION=-